MIRKVLVANRGEIACRVMRTCRRLGVATVAVYSDADAKALHVAMADEARRIGPAPARDSYLRAEEILRAARETGADAVHPGYGFLSENADFAQACADAGLTFIGPPPAAIRAMGGKSESKALMEAAGVPLCPGYHGARQEEDFLRAEAERIGWPVLIKASAGGGGKGMRVVEEASAFADALASARREAKASFGDDRVLIEKYLLNPRHVEIQVFADAKGRTVYMFERDCSVQRRHQKVVEEAPAPGLLPETRRRMGEAAVAAAKAIGYTGAGTVEFLLDARGDFYFMEMNTRLQVEHPVTEMITGLDLVELQIRVAQGEALPVTQADLKINGHAFEARLYAEDPRNGFLPGAGRLKHLSFPPGDATIRIDSGVRTGDDITIFYDPMIAKIVTWGPDRAAALAALAAALDDTHVAGPKSNLLFLRALARDPVFAAGGVSTGYIAERSTFLLPPPSPAPVAALALAAGAVLDHGNAQDAADPWSARSFWRMGGGAPGVLCFEDEAGRYEVEALSARWRSDSVVLRDSEAVTVMYRGCDVVLRYDDPLAVPPDAEAGAGRLSAPMPGKVVAVLVLEGAMVEKGQPLVIVEAMKMEHSVTAPRAGKIVRIHVAVGDQVDEKRELVSLAIEG